LQPTALGVEEDKIREEALQTLFQTHPPLAESLKPKGEQTHLSHWLLGLVEVITRSALGQLHQLWHSLFTVLAPKPPTLAQGQAYQPTRMGSPLWQKEVAQFGQGGSAKTQLQQVQPYGREALSPLDAEQTPAEEGLDVLFGDETQGSIAQSVLQTAQEPVLPKALLLPEVATAPNAPLWHDDLGQNTLGLFVVPLNPQDEVALMNEEVARLFAQHAAEEATEEAIKALEAKETQQAPVAPPAPRVPVTPLPMAPVTPPAAAAAEDEPEYTPLLRAPQWAVEEQTPMPAPEAPFEGVDVAMQDLLPTEPFEANEAEAMEEGLTLNEQHLKRQASCTQDSINQLVNSYFSHEAND
jgi:uncharacterized small protein (DUF1192 family)